MGLKKSTYYTKADWYYIYNAKYNGYRIGKWGWGDRATGIWNGNYADDQLWKFVPYGNKANNVYIIKNKKYGTAKMAKWGKGDSDWGTYTGKDGDDQHWKLTPRYTASKADNVIFQVCNRGSTPLSRVITYVKGLTLSTSKSLTTTTNLKASLVYASSGVVASTSVSREIKSSLKTSSTKNWSKTVKTTYTVPAGVDYKVTQQIINFNPTKGLKDKLVLHSSTIRIAQSNLNSTTTSHACPKNSYG